MIGRTSGAGPGVKQEVSERWGIDEWRKLASTIYKYIYIYILCLSYIYYIYVTVNLRNQSYLVLTDMFRHYAKLLFHSGISRND